MNIILVDDELQILSWLELMLKKTELPLTIMGSFSNGAEALEFCLNHTVDLVITDIRMPIMDGLKLIQQLKREKPQTRFLILSAFEEFQYASEGMRLGASDYLLKAEMTVEDLREVLQRIKKDIAAERQIGHELMDMRMALNGNQYALRIFYLKELIEGDELAIQNFAKKKQFLELDIEYQSIILLAIGFAREDFEQTVKMRFQSKELLDLSIVNVIDETLAVESVTGNAFPMEAGRFAVIVNIPNTGSKSIRERYLHYSSRILANLWRYLELRASIGISEWYGDISYLKEQWQEASQALEHNLFYRKHTMISYRDLQDDASHHKNDSKHIELYDRLLACLESDRYRSFQEALANYMQYIEATQRMSENNVKSEFVEIIYKLRRKMQALSITIPDEAPLTSLQARTTYTDCKSWLQQHVDLFIQNIEQMKRSPSIQKLVDFLENNYMREISLQEAAEVVHLNKTYLSGLFKKELGVNFNDYLTQIRINKAKELIRTNICSIGELAEKVGYTNQSHFTKVFKKTVGISPLEYKKKFGHH